MNFLIAIVTLFLSPAMLCLYSLHAAIYAALFSWPAWYRRIEAQDEARRQRLRDRGAM
jgi:hypothetical protein